MNNKELEKLKELLYCEDSEEIKKEVKHINNSILLHIFAANYNWDNGFEIPNIIINNEHCDLGTALMMFYSADGYRLLENQTNVFSSQVTDWKEFTFNLYHKIKNNEFKKQEISFTPQLSKVQIYKLKKTNPNIPDVFLNKSPGNEIEIPIL
jgi:hypothetical protein